MALGIAARRSRFRSPPDSANCRGCRRSQSARRGETTTSPPAASSFSARNMAAALLFTAMPGAPTSRSRRPGRVRVAPAAPSARPGRIPDWSSRGSAASGLQRRAAEVGMQDHARGVDDSRASEGDLRSPAAISRTRSSTGRDRAARRRPCGVARGFRPSARRISFTTSAPREALERVRRAAPEPRARRAGRAALGYRPRIRW